MVSIILGIICIGVGVGLWFVAINLEYAEEDYTEDYERWA